MLLQCPAELLLRLAALEDLLPVQAVVDVEGGEGPAVAGLTHRLSLQEHGGQIFSKETVTAGWV